MKVAIVHDWLTTWAGAEKVLGVMLERYPQAELFTIVNLLKPGIIKSLEGRTIHTSFIQKLPGVKRNYRRYLPLMPLAIEQFDLKGFDLILSCSHAVAKGIIPDPNAIHVCYCYSPMRYAWDMQHQYMRQVRSRGFSAWLMRWQLHKLRMWDFASAQRVDYFIAISFYIQRRIEKTYRRQADVIYPPVDVEKFNYRQPSEGFYLAASRLVPYKRIDLVIEAFNRMPDKQLIVIGDGPERARLESIAGRNVCLKGYEEDGVLISHLERARAFVFMGEEDFGILPVEAQAAGTPVIGYGIGGVAETVINGVTGLHVSQQTVEALMDTLNRFERQQGCDSNAFSPQSCRQQAERFTVQRFNEQLDTWFDNLPQTIGNPIR